MAAAYRISPLKVGFLPDLTKVTTTYLLNQGGLHGPGRHRSPQP